MHYLLQIELKMPYRHLTYNHQNVQIFSGKGKAGLNNLSKKWEPHLAGNAE